LFGPNLGVNLCPPPQKMSFSKWNFWTVQHRKLKLTLIM